jgi:hypothetical protein
MLCIGVSSPLSVDFLRLPKGRSWNMILTEARLLLSTLLIVIQSSNHLSFSSNSVLTVQRGGCPLFGVQEVFISNFGRQTGYPGLPIKMAHGI